MNGKSAFLLGPQQSKDLSPPKSFRNVGELPYLIRRPTSFLNDLKQRLFVPRVLFVNFFLVMPIEVLLRPYFFMVLALMVASVPRLKYYVTRVPSRIHVFPTSLCKYFL